MSNPSLTTMDMEETSEQEAPGSSGEKKVIFVTQTVKKFFSKRKADDAPELPNKRINLDLGHKGSVLKWIVTCHLRLLKVLKEKDYNDLHLGTQLTSAITTTHNILRQEANGSGAVLAEKAANGFNIKWGNKEINLSLENMKALLNQTAACFGLGYKKATSDETTWYSTAAPYLTFLIGFNQRLKEIRAGHTMLAMPENTPAAERYKYNIRYYGFNQAHSVLMDGISFAPEKKSSIGQSLGVGTALIQIFKTKDQPHRFRKKWIDAVVRDLKHIPEIDKMAHCIIHGAHEDVMALMGKMGDAALALGNRSIHRAYFPISFLIASLFTDDDREKACVLVTPGKDGGWGTWGSFDPVGTQLLNKGFFSQSGPGAYECYRLATEGERKFKMPKTCDADIMQQAAFHAIWGTFCEDLSILSFATERKQWGNRASFGKFMDKFGSTSETMTFDLPQFRRGCKLAAANMYAPDNSGERTVMINPVFARKRTIPVKDSMLEYFKTNNSSAFYESNRTASTYVRILQQMINTATEKWRANPAMPLGTVEWMQASTEIVRDSNGKERLQFKGPAVEGPVGKMLVFY
ncbi:hypothetical protein LSTR_LSTR010848 [Laodelphax striatellus]|uniref:Nucleocapsid protein n=1 Tax=Laodelphax striatellus TaxID=195883 RepID=A0A482WSI3_LAOST|nr:hypothetical protein LSTR_LSTR010848 [Laodelphax striatellus]